MSSSGAPSTPSYSVGHSTPPSYNSGPSTPPSYSSGPSTPTNYSLRSSRNGECSNCKHLRGKISVLKATMEMHMHPEQHTVNSVALFHEVLNEMEKLDLESGTSAVSKNYSDSEYSDLLHLPFPNQTDALNHFHGESGSKAFETNLTHPFHRHPLTLVDTPYCSNDINTTPSSSRITTSSIHDSMKMVEVVCNACIRPIKNIPFYKCTASDDGCDFVLHALCTRLPAKVKTMYYSHTYNFKLLPQAPYFVGLFRCYFCDLLCNGFVYYWEEEDLEVDVHCALNPQCITHKSHPNHLLVLSKLGPSAENYCRLCLSDAKKQLVYNCEHCKFTIHSKCAVMWPDTISHKYDKHQLTLRYFPVENYNGDYFCEVCEEEFNPNGAFYHCDQCVQSMHLACCVSIPQKETTYTPFCPDKGVAEFDNVKFGDRFKVNGHPHVVSLSRGVESDGRCAKCGSDLEDKLILKCLQCKFAIDIDCADRYDYSPKPIV
ncbi:zinc finger, PHD-type containing protein [Tanacetum coccineum]